MLRGMKLVLAPMQDVTDLAFMRTLDRIGSLPDAFITPYFRSTSSACALAEDNLRCIRENETSIPIWAQIAGSEAAPMARDAEALLSLPVAGININAGCPSPLVNRHGAGAALLNDLSKFSNILKTLRAVVPQGKLGIKTRLGWESSAEFPAILETLKNAAPDEVSVHCRTRKQLYGGSPHEAAAKRAAKSLSCPVLGNGDIVTREQAVHWLNDITPAGILIGRGAVRNPYIFRQIRGGATPSRDDMKCYYRILVEETRNVLRAKRTEAGHCNRMKKYLAFCYPDFTAEQEYTLRRCLRIADMLRILEG